MSTVAERMASLGFSPPPVEDEKAPSLVEQRMADLGFNPPPANVDATGKTPGPDTANADRNLTFGEAARVTGAGLTTLAAEHQDVIPAVGNLGIAGWNWATDSNVEPWRYPSDVAPGIKQIKENFGGIPAELEDNKQAQALHSGVQWAHPKKWLTPVASATAGNYVGRELGGETGATIAEIGAGLTNPSRIPVAVGKKVGQKLTDVGTFGYTARQRRVTQQTKEVTDLIALHATYPERAQALLKQALETGDNGPLSELMNDQGIANLSKTRSSGGVNPALSDQLADLVSERETLLLDEIGDLAPGTPTSRVLRDESQADVAQQIAGLEGQRAAELGEVEQASTLAERNRQTIETTLAGTKTAEGQGLAQATAAEAQRLAGIEKGSVGVLEQSVNAAQEAQTRAMGEVYTPVKPVQASTALATEAANLKQSIKDGPVAEAWAKFDAAQPVDAADMREKLEQMFEALDPALQSETAKKYGSYLKHIGDSAGEPLVAPQTIQSVMNLVKAKMREASQSGNYSSVEDAVSSFRRVMTDFMNDVPGHKEAVAETRYMHQRLSDGQVDAALREDPVSFVSKMGGWKGRNGVETGQAFMRTLSPEIRQKGRQSLRSELRDGLDNPDNLLKDGQFGQALDLYPDLKRNVENLSVKKQELEIAERALKEGKAAAAAVRKEGGAVATAAENAGLTASKEGYSAQNRELKNQYDALKKQYDAQKSRINVETTTALSAVNASKFKKFSDDPTKYVRGVLKQEKSTVTVQDDMKRLLENVRRFGGEEQLKNELFDVLKDITGPQRVDARRLTAASVERFNDMRPTLENSGALTKDELDTIDELLSRGQKGTALAAGATTEKAILTHSSFEKANLIASVGAFATSSVLNVKSLMATAAIRRSLLRDIRDTEAKYDPEKLKLIDSFLADPAKFQAAVDKTNPDAFNRLIEGSPAQRDEAMWAFMSNYFKGVQTGYAVDDLVNGTEEEE